MTLPRCLAAALLLPVLLAAPPLPAQDQPIPVIISTDTATGLANGWREGVSDIDDGLAIAMALDLDALDVRGVVVTWGNNLMEPELAIAERVVAGMSADVPVVRGAARALPEHPVTRYDGATVDGACLNEGVIFMAAELAASATPVTVIAIGPLTDVACLALNFPEAAGRIGKVVVIGGRAPDEAFVINGVYLSDFNMALDDRALRYLLEETDVPLQFMPFELTSSVLVPAADRDKLCASTLPLAADFLCPAILPWLEQWQKTFDEDGFHPWDQNAVFATAHPAAFDCRPATYRLVDCAEGACAGHDPNDPTRLASETMQLWLSPDGDSGRITICNGYAPGGRDAFADAIFAFAE